MRDKIHAPVLEVVNDLERVRVIGDAEIGAHLFPLGAGNRDDGWSIGLKF